LTTDKGNRTVAVVSTDGQYQYLGRLLVDFNANGEIVGTGGDTIPATAAQVTSLWGADAPYAAGTRGGTVKALTDAVGAVINSKDGLILGRSSVYLEGRRTAVRQQETNFGNLSADANLWYAKQYDATTRVSLKNGGGIRNAIGSTSANGTLQPTKANLTANKTAGDISRLDVEDSLKFNNALTVLTVKASQLKMLLEHGVAGSNGSGADKNTPGQFSQLGGLVAAADLSRTAQTYTSSNNVISAVNSGDRILYVALTDAQGNPTDVIVANGQVLEPDRLIRMVTLNFLANAGSTGSDFGGDNYPFPYISRLNGSESYSRKDLNSGTLNPALPGNFPALSTFAGNGTEQDAFAEYLLAFHSTTPFAVEDKGVDLDRRIVQGTADTDGDGYTNADEVSLFTLGMNADSAATAGQLNALTRVRSAGRSDVSASPGTYNLYTATQLSNERQSGRSDVTTNPSAYGLYDATSIMDLKLGGLVIQKTGDSVKVNFQVQTTTDLAQPFTDEGDPITRTLNMPAGKGFLRIRAK
jgi:hypothetical protein